MVKPFILFKDKQAITRKQAAVTYTDYKNPALKINVQGAIVRSPTLYYIYM